MNTPEQTYKRIICESIALIYQQAKEAGCANLALKRLGRAQELIDETCYIITQKKSRNNDTTKQTSGEKAA